MKNITIMIKPASSACNLQCKYCFYTDLAGKRDTYNFGKMSKDTVEKILANVFVDLVKGDKLNFAFQGGEPTLVGIEWYKNFVKTVNSKNNGITISYALQTNGTLIDNEWCEFLTKNKFLVGISIDAMPKTHNNCRIDINKKGTYNIVSRTVKLMEKNKVEFNVLCTLTSEIAQHPKQVWDWIIQNDFKYVQFTPCLDALDENGKNIYAINPKKYYGFYSELFKFWFNDFRQGKYRSIKLFDDIVNLLAYNIPTACGINGKCSCQIVVESNGNTYPCDFYCIDKYCLGNLSNTHLSNIVQSSAVNNFINREKSKPTLCNTCKYNIFCGSGCYRMQKEIYCKDNSNFCGYKAFLDDTINYFQMIADSQLKII